jgi:hypothetical protein
MRKEKELLDFAVATTKGAVGSIPFVGGLLSEYIGLVQEKVSDKKSQEWKTLVEERLGKVEVGIEELSEDEFFFSCFQTASLNAAKAYQTEKREMFANALYNSIELKDISEEKKLTFLNLLDKYTLGTIKLLKHYSLKHYNPLDYIRKSGMMTTTIHPGTEHPVKYILEKNPEFVGEGEYIRTMTTQLINDGLVRIIDWDIPVGPEQAREKKTTKLGDEFISYITGR